MKTAVHAPQQPRKFGQDAAAVIGEIGHHGFGALGAGEQHQHLFAVFVRDDQRLRPGRALEALDRIFFVEHRHEDLLVEQTQYEGFSIGFAVMHGDQFLFEVVVGNEVHGSSARGKTSG